jgi:hypothetical protein
MCCGCSGFLFLRRNCDYGFDRLAAEWKSLTIKKASLGLAVKVDY